METAFNSVALLVCVSCVDTGQICCGVLVVMMVDMALASDRITSLGYWLFAGCLCCDWLVEVAVVLPMLSLFNCTISTCTVLLCWCLLLENISMQVATWSYR